MLVSIYYKLCLLNAHTMLLIVHIFMNVNKLCLKQRGKRDGRGRDSQTEKQKVGVGAGWLGGGGGGGGGGQGSRSNTNLVAVLR